MILMMMGKLQNAQLNFNCLSWFILKFVLFESLFPVCLLFSSINIIIIDLNEILKT